MHCSARDVIRGLFVTHHRSQLCQKCQSLCCQRALLAHLAQEVQQLHCVLVLGHAFKARDQLRDILRGELVCDLT